MSLIKQEKPEKRIAARDKIFYAAKRLFYRYGIRSVGVESIATEAGTTKMSLYRNFACKDELVAECMRDHVREFWDWWDSVLAKAPKDPKKKILALMDAFTCQECAEHSRGCPLSNAAIELHEENHPGRQVILENKTEMRARLLTLCNNMDATEAQDLADALFMIIEGAYLSQLSFKKNGPADAVPRITQKLIEMHTSST